MKNQHSGTFTQPTDIKIDISKLYECLSDTITELVSDYFSTKNADTSDSNIAVEFEDNDIVLENLSYSGTYSHTHYNATELEPPEDNYDFSPNEYDFSSSELMQYLQEHSPKWLKPMLSNVRITIDTSDCKLTESEPDWDSMHGGYNDL